MKIDDTKRRIEAGEFDTPAVIEETARRVQVELNHESDAARYLAEWYRLRRKVKQENER